MSKQVRRAWFCEILIYAFNERPSAANESKMADTCSKVDDKLIDHLTKHTPFFVMILNRICELVRKKFSLKIKQLLN